MLKDIAMLTKELAGIVEEYKIEIRPVSSGFHLLIRVTHKNGNFVHLLPFSYDYCDKLVEDDPDNIFYLIKDFLTTLKAKIDGVSNE